MRVEEGRGERVSDGMLGGREGGAVEWGRVSVGFKLDELTRAVVFFASCASHCVCDPVELETELRLTQSHCAVTRLFNTPTHLSPSQLTPNSPQLLQLLMVNPVNAASLPFPVSAPRGRYHTAGTSPFHRSRSGDRLSFLVSRARTTNLAVLILAAVSVLSVLINIRLYLGDAVRTLPSPPPDPSTNV